MEENKPAGIKFDQEKLRWDLLPTKPLESLIRVLMLGSRKYGDENWKGVPECRRRYYSAAMRHLTAWKEGETLDPESGISHLGHAVACLIFLLWHEENNTPEFTGIPSVPTKEEEEPWQEIKDTELSDISDETPHPLHKVVFFKKMDDAINRLEDWLLGGFDKR